MNYNYSYLLFVTVIITTSEILFANIQIKFICTVDNRYGVQWLINDSLYSGDDNFKMHDDISIGILTINNSSSIGNGSIVICQATNNGRVIESSKPKQLILQGTYLY